MIIKNYGKIFDVSEINVEYAKSPQAICFKDYVRIYFSYCEKDGNKLISRVAFVDFTKDFSRWLRYSKNVIDRGVLGAYDEHGIFPFSPFVDGNTIKAMLSGWSRRVSVSVDTGIGLACSDEKGEVFTHFGNGPVMSSSIEDPFLVVDGFVVKNEGLYHMFYIFGTEWNIFSSECNTPERTYKIGHAVSQDLLNWKRDGVALLKDKFPYESQALPSVVYYKNVWHMFFCYRHSVGFRESKEKSYRIGYAYSTDLREWHREDNRIQIPIENWNEGMQCYPNVFLLDNEMYMLYNGNYFGKEGFGLLKIRP